MDHHRRVDPVSVEIVARKVGIIFIILLLSALFRLFHCLHGTLMRLGLSCELWLHSLRNPFCRSCNHICCQKSSQCIGTLLGLAWLPLQPSPTIGCPTFWRHFISHPVDGVIPHSERNDKSLQWPPLKSRQTVFQKQILTTQQSIS